MRNYKRRTKLEINKTFIKGIRTKIINKKNKDWNWIPRTKRIIVHFLW
jgi:hypothetical protein